MAVKYRAYRCYCRLNNREFEAVELENGNILCFGSGTNGEKCNEPEGNFIELCTTEFQELLKAGGTP